MPKILLEFKLEDTKIDRYVKDDSFQEYKKFIKNYMVNKYNSQEYSKAEAAKELLEHLYYLELKKKKKSWHLF